MSYANWLLGYSVRWRLFARTQIVLGAEAKQDEFNVVEVFTLKSSRRIPIAVLKAGETHALNPDVAFFERDTVYIQAH